MARYVLHTTNADGPTVEEVALIEQQSTILDQSRRAILVEADHEHAVALACQLTGWTVQPEMIIPIPDTRRLK